MERLKNNLRELAERINSIKDQINTEEATKNALIMPFIQMLGYDVFNPLEVVPEMDCDLVKKKGEKIDYAIMKDGDPIMLIECKHWKQDLNLHDNQLKKYYVASKAKFGVLTNGIEYRFYADLVKQNIMDDMPFLVVNMDDLRDAHIEELKKFHKSNFDVINIMSSASELKYLTELRKLIRAEFTEPSPDFVRMLARKVYESTVTQKVLDQFTALTKRAMKGYINDVVADRLNMAIAQEEEVPAIQEEIVEETPVEEKNKIVTTEEEIEAYYIVKSIVRDVLPVERVAFRDAVEYLTIIADDNNRKLICRLYLNGKKKYMVIIKDNNKIRYDIENINDLYSHADALIESANRYK